jgi:hypothetical protein
MLPENAPHRIPTAFRTAPRTAENYSQGDKKNETDRRMEMSDAASNIGIQNPDHN